MKKLIIPIMSSVTALYTLWYASGENPFKNSGALSKIGLIHPILFTIWGSLTFLTLSFGIVTLYKKYTKTKVYIPLLLISAIGMALTLIFDFDYDIKPDYYFHCAGSLVFSAVTGFTVFLLFLLCYNKDILFKVFTYITAAVLIVDLVLLIIFKETAAIEIFPVFTGYVLLSILSLRRDKVEIKK